MIKYTTTKVDSLNNTTNFVISSQCKILFDTESAGDYIFYIVTDTGELYLAIISNTSSSISKVEITSDLSDSAKFLGITKNEDSYYILVEDNGTKYVTSYNTSTKVITKLGTIVSDKIEGEDKEVAGITYYRNNSVLIGNSSTQSKLLRYSLNSNAYQTKYSPQGICSILDIKYFNEREWILGQYLNKLNEKETKLFVWDSSMKLMQVVNLPNSSYNFTSFDVTSDTIWLSGANESSLVICRYSLVSEVKKISSVYFIKHAILKIIAQGKTIWSILSGCFATGKWISSEKWSNNDIWKDN